MNGALQALGGLGLFLLGMKTLTDGLESLAGRMVRRSLSRFTRSPTSGAITGAIMTMILQSSSLTTVAAVGFVSAGLLTFPQALGIIFGANAGTTVKGWLVALLGFKLDLGLAVAPIILPGILLHLIAKRRASAIGLAVCGIGLILVGLDFLKNGMAGMQDVITPETLPDNTVLGRLALVGIGFLITLVTQSSSAGVAAALAAVHTGSIELAQAAALVIGMDVGTTTTAALATIGAPSAARRTGLAHVIYNVMTAVMAFVILPLYLSALLQWLPGSVDDPELALVGFHTLFNWLGVFLVLPLAGWFADFMTRVVPDRQQAWAGHLSPGLLERPAAALDAVHGALRELVPKAVRAVGAGIRDPNTWSHTRETLEATARAAQEVQRYLDLISAPGLHVQDRFRYRRALHTIDHLLRLARRCARREPDPEARADPMFTRAADALVRVLEAFPDAPDAGYERRAADLRTTLGDEDEAYRREVMARAAESAFEADAAEDRMDEFRFLRRIAHHAWRMAHHLRLADSTEPPVDEDGDGEPDWDA